MAICAFAQTTMVTVKYGQITTSTENACDFKNNGIMYSKPKGIKDVPGLWFGFIDYNCTDTSGHVFSKIECKDCGLYCTYNEQILQCKQDLSVFLIGFFSGLAIFLIIILMLKKNIRNTVFYFYHWIRYKYYCKIDKHDYLKACQNRRLLDVPMMLRFKTVQLPTNLLKELYKKREKYRQKLNKKCQEPDYVEMTSIKAEEANPTPGLTNKEILATALTAGLILTGAPSASACDTTLFINGQGMICDDTNCISPNIFQIPMLSDSKICFKDTSGSNTEIWFSTVQHRVLYSEMYYTSNWTLSSESLWNCERKGECSSLECTETSRHGDFKTKSKIEGFTCLETTLDCDTYCDSNTIFTGGLIELVHLQKYTSSQIKGGKLLQM